MDSGFMARLARRHKHVVLHRLWVCAQSRERFTVREHLHLGHCKECRSAFDACLAAENFGQVLKELSRQKSRHSDPESSIES